MAFTPVSNTVPQYSKNASGASASGYYLKFYADGTTTPISMATDSTGGTLLAKCELDSLGYPTTDGTNIFIPHIDQAYKLALYANATDADNNTLASAAWVVDNIEQNATTDSVISQILSSQDYVKNFDVLSSAVADVNLVAGDSLSIAERTSGAGGASVWDVVLSSTVTENTYDIVQCTGVPTLSLVLRQGNIIDPQAYGCAGDGLTDDLLPLQRIVEILENGMILRGSKTREYGVSAALLIRDTSLRFRIEDFNIKVLASGTGLTSMLRLDVDELIAVNSRFTGLEDDTAYTVLLDGTHATDATGRYTFENCFAGYARLAAIQLRRVKFFKFINGEVEDISEFHGITAERTQQFGFAACERIIVKDSEFREIPGLAVDGHSLFTTVDNNRLINSLHCSKSQLSLNENGAAGANPMTNVDVPTRFSVTNNKYDLDYSTAKYAAQMLSQFVSPEFVFNTSEYGESKGNTIVVKNLPAAIQMQYCTAASVYDFVSRDNSYTYDCPLAVSSPPLRISTTAKFTFENDSFDIEQFNEHFIQSTGPAEEIALINLKIRLGSVDNLDRKIVGSLCEAGLVKIIGSSWEGDTAGQVFRPIFVNVSGIVDNIIIDSCHQIDGNQPFVDNLGFSTKISNNVGITDIATGITAFATGGQASATQLYSGINKISTVASSGDSVKLRPAAANIQQKIINGGANSCDVFPSSGDDLGAGVDTAISLSAGSEVTYLAVDDTNWAQV